MERPESRQTQQTLAVVTVFIDRSKRKISLSRDYYLEEKLYYCYSVHWQPQFTNSHVVASQVQATLVETDSEPKSPSWKPDDLLTLNTINKLHENKRQCNTLKMDFDESIHTAHFGLFVVEFRPRPVQVGETPEIH